MEKSEDREKFIHSPVENKKKGFLTLFVFNDSFFKICPQFVAFPGSKYGKMLEKGGKLCYDKTTCSEGAGNETIHSLCITCG